MRRAGFPGSRREPGILGRMAAADRAAGGRRSAPASHALRRPVGTRVSQARHGLRQSGQGRSRSVCQRLAAEMFTRAPSGGGCAKTCRSISRVPGKCLRSASTSPTVSGDDQPARPASIHHRQRIPEVLWPAARWRHQDHLHLGGRRSSARSAANRGEVGVGAPAYPAPGAYTRRV